MASAAFVTEFRSFISFECGTSPTQYLNSKTFNVAKQKMAPQDLPRMLEGKNIVGSPTVRNLESPMSSPGTSGESSGSPESQPIKGALNMTSTMIYPSPPDERNGTENSPDHLKRMEGILEKNGIIGQNLSCNYEEDSDDELEPHKTYDLNDSRTTIPKCHFCGFLAVSKDEYNSHIHTHFPYKCTDCSYMSRTKGRLENHKKNHREVPDYWPDMSVENGRGMDGNGDFREKEDDDESNGNKKNRPTKCRHCDFVGQSKSEYYAHLRQRLCFTGPLLECAFETKKGTICDFCTHYKHHLEYHIRNHFESKPYKCSECKYICVNQSMLNSHMKSHSSIYPYRCKSCSYVTKYLHSLKMHLHKYNHEPDEVLNSDGTVNKDIIIDVNGRRRGPKPKKAKSSNSTINQGASTSTTSPPHSSTNYNTNPTVSPLHQPFMYPLFSGAMFNNTSHGGIYTTPLMDHAMPFRYSPPMDTTARCVYPNCEFIADSTHALQQHLAGHYVNNYQGPMGINPARFPFHLDMQGSGVFHFGSDNSVFGAHFQNGVENIPRTQADSHSHFRQQEHTEVRTPGAFKLSDKILNGMEMRRRISPPISNGNLSHDFEHSNEPRNPVFDYLYNKQKGIDDMKKLTLVEDSLNRLRNSSRSSSLSPPSIEQAGASCSNSSNGTCYDAGWDYTSPMDLTKNLPSTSKICNGVDTGSKPKSQNTTPVSIQQQPVKHRRKGKAFKLDQYMQYEDHSPEHTNSLFDMENKFQKHQPNESNVKMEVEDLSVSSPRINGVSQVPNRKCQTKKLKTSEKNSTSKRIKSFSQASFQVSSNRCSTPKAPTTAIKNGHSLSNGDGLLFREFVSSGEESGFYSEGNKPDKINSGTLSASLNHQLISFNNGVSRCSSASPELMDKKEPKTSKQTTNNQEPNDTQTCFHCKIGFSDFIMLCMHMSCHTVGNPFKCQKCNEDCKDRVKFMYHILNECKRG